MTSRARLVTIRQAAATDTSSIFLYLATEATLEIAEEFLQALAAAYKHLQRFPEIGMELSGYSPDIQMLRRWPVPGFANYLVYHRMDNGGVDIVRILHGARDVHALLKDF